MHKPSSIGCSIERSQLYHSTCQLNSSPEQVHVYNKAAPRGMPLTAVYCTQHIEYEPVYSSHAYMFLHFLLTSAGFRRITTNCSARCIRKLVNLWQRIVSISSACFTAILTRTLLTLVSMRHFSCSLRQIVTGLSRSSLLDLRWSGHETESSCCHIPNMKDERWHPSCPS